MAAKRGDEPPVPRARRTSLAKLGRDADGGTDAAINELTDRAGAHGIDPDDYPTWAELATAIDEADRSNKLDIEVVKPRARRPLSLDELAEKADEDHLPSMRKLVAMAEDAGLDPDDYETWADLAVALADDEADEEADGGADVEVVPVPAAEPSGFCTKCGAPLDATSERCAQCGTRRGAAPALYGVAPRTNGLAIASLILGIFPVAYVGAYLAIIFGVRARHQIRDSNGTQTGRGLATAGIVLGCIMCVLVPLVAVPIFLGATHFARNVSATTEYLNGVAKPEFVSPDGTFHVTFPATPETKQNTIAGGGQSIALTEYVVDARDRSFEVGEYSFAKGTPFNLAAAATGAANGAHGTLQSSRLTKVQGYEADEFIIVAQGVYLKGLVVHTPAHAYLVIVGGNENPPLGYDRFRTSFKITGNA